MAARPVTDFPEPGGTRRVSLRTSRHPAFDLRYALDLRSQHMELWQRGAALAGEEGFATLIPVQRRGGSVRNPAEEAAVRRREAWAAEHAQRDDLEGVIAQIRWLVVGRLGTDAMKALVNREKPGR